MNKYNEFSVYLEELKGILLKSNNPRESMKIALEKCVDYYDATSCSIIIMDTRMNKWKLIWTYNKVYNTMSVYHETIVNDIHNVEFARKVLDECKIIKVDREFIKQNNLELKLMEHTEFVMASPFRKNPSGFIIVADSKRHVDNYGCLSIITLLVYKAAQEKMLIDVAHNYYHPNKLVKYADVIIHLFGRFEIVTSNGTLDDKVIKKMQAIQLIEYMIIQKNYTNIDLSFEIWPDMDINNALNSLRVLVNYINNNFRMISDTKLIISNNQSYQFNDCLNIISDIDILHSTWIEYQNCVSTQTKVQILIKAFDIYKGKIYGNFEIQSIENDYIYEHEYIGIVNELLECFYGIEEYLLVIKYAAESLKIAPNNPKGYFWMISSLQKIGKNELARSKNKIAKFRLCDEDYQILCDFLKKIKKVLKLMPN